MPMGTGVQWRLRSLARLAALTAGVLLHSILAVAIVPKPEQPLLEAAQRPETMDVRVGVYEDFPMVFVEDGQPRGLFVDVIEEVAREEGWHIRWVHGTWSEVFNATARGDIDILLSIALLPERRDRFDFAVVPVEIGWGQVAIARQDNYEVPEDLRGKSIGVMTDDAHGIRFQMFMRERGVPAVWVHFQDYTAILEALQQHTIDAGVVNNLYARGDLSEYGAKLSNIMFSPVALTFATRKGQYNRFLLPIDKKMAVWRQDPDSQFYHSRERWLRAVERRALPSWVRSAFAAAVAVLLAVSLWAWTLRRTVSRRTAALVLAQDRLAHSLKQLEAAHSRLETVMTALPDALWALSRRGEVIAIYGDAREFPVPEDEMLGFPLVQSLDPDSSAKFMRSLDRALRTGRPESFVMEPKDASGELLRYEVRLSPLAEPEDAVAALALLRDVSEVVALKTAFQENIARMKAFAQAMPDLGFILNEKGDYVAVFGADETLLVAPADQLINRNIRDVLPAELCDRMIEFIFAALESDSVQSFEYSVEVPAGLRHFEARIAPIHASGELREVAMTARDITRRVQSEDEIRRLAYYDVLTGLPNRKLLFDRLKQAVFQAKRSGQALSVLMLDLDGFKEVNDSLGHPAGDALLQEVARRLRDVLRQSDTVARIGGDEFVVIQTLVQDADDAAALCEKIRRELQRPVSLGESVVTVETSIGITVYQGEDVDVEELIRQADLALYEAKSAGKARFSFFDKSMSEQFLAQVNLIHRLRDAIACDEFELHYQPQIDVRTHAIIGLEALVRWPQKDGGYLAPARFIPLAERTGVIFELDRLIMQRVVQQLAVWLEAGIAPQTLAFNVSAMEFQQPEFARTLVELIREHGIDPGRLEVEITESIFLKDMADVAESLAILEEHGVRLSIDDFGTGYSSMQYLKRLPVYKLKIDMEFVQHITESQSDREITRAIISLARSLELTCLAEGVETPEQLTALRQYGCDSVQGFLFSPALPVHQVEPLLRRGKLLPGADPS